MLSARSMGVGHGHGHGHGIRLVVSLILVGLVCGACAPGGGGGGGRGKGRRGGTAPGGGAGGGPPTSIRLVGVPREALSPSSSPRIWLFAELPAGVDPLAYVLEESADGVTFAPLPSTGAGAPAALVLPQAIRWDLPAVAADRYYRVSAPIPSNRVRVEPPGAAASVAVAALTVAQPAPGAAAVPRAPAVAIAGGSGAASFLTIVADDVGTIVWLAESVGPGLALGVTGAVATFASPAGGGAGGGNELAGGRGHVAAVVALDGEAFGVAAAPRVDFTTAP